MLEDRLVIVCCVCPSIRYKGQWVNVGETGMNLVRSWGYTFSHTYCDPCYEKAMEVLKNGDDTNRPRQGRR